MTGCKLCSVIGCMRSRDASLLMEVHLTLENEAERTKNDDYQKSNIFSSLAGFFNLLLMKLSLHCSISFVTSGKI